MVALLDAFFEGEFFRSIAKNQQPRTRRGAAASQRLEQLGFKVEPALARLIDFIQVHDALEIGQVSFFDIDDVIAGAENPLAFLLAQPFRVDATLLHAFPLGTTGAGDLWLVSLAPQRRSHEVFLLSHDAGTVELAADSLEAFLFAAHLTDREEPATAAEQEALVGHVQWSDDLDLEWLQTESPEATTAPVPQLFERTEDLRAVLNGFSEHEPAPAAKLSASPLPAEALDALLRAFLRGDDDQFQTLAQRFANAAPELVRKAIVHLQDLAARGGAAAFEHRKNLLLETAA